MVGNPGKILETWRKHGAKTGERDLIGKKGWKTWWTCGGTKGFYVLGENCEDVGRMSLWGSGGGSELESPPHFLYVHTSITCIILLCIDDVYMYLYLNILFYIIVYYTILYDTILYYSILYYIILYYIILYYTILYYIILYYIILYYIILYYTILYYIILYYIILYYIILYYIILYYIILYYIIVYYVMLYYIMLYLYYTILYHIILYYIILYYTILYYIILYYIILYYIVLYMHIFYMYIIALSYLHTYVLTHSLTYRSYPKVRPAPGDLVAGAVSQASCHALVGRTTCVTRDTALLILLWRLRTLSYSYGTILLSFWSLHMVLAENRRVND